MLETISKRKKKMEAIDKALFLGVLLIDEEPPLTP